MTEPDTDLLPYTRTQLSNAISALVDNKPTSLVDEDGGETQIVWVTSLYEQLVDAKAGFPQEHMGVARSRPPFWTEAVNQLHEIDREVAQWIPGPGDTVERLRAIDAEAWSPEDVALLNSWAKQLERWCAKINDILHPGARKTLNDPCPSCGEKTVYRWQDGERLRQPALQISTDGIWCQNRECDFAHEFPERLAFVCRLLGYEIPPGVFE
ncbi:hypothetical protein A5742_16415 [Mycolicibacterium fortuitum]|uniref:Uncharacterized protein n=1 Tax=Mycolicibacterium fortuitum TaxID=1766 RepID=A0ABD6QTU0_MYCFO|nr:hypothetical protein [Mycolicibacterium fortuitum]OMC52532.1 hypothetical protein A5742_16415 [Mycolicibacterium fortuitum]